MRMYEWDYESNTYRIIPDSFHVQVLCNCDEAELMYGISRLSFRGEPLTREEVKEKVVLSEKLYGSLVSGKWFLK